MIAYIDGKLAFKDPTYVVVDVQGVGYLIKIPLSTFSLLSDGERCKLYTHLVVKEDSHTLYGFSDLAEKEMFLHLISVSGVGPNTGLMMLSSLSVGELQHAIAREDVRTIQGVKGIGAKTAQRVILELKDKVKKSAMMENAGLSAVAYNTNREEALSALVTLGFAKSAAEKSLDSIIKKEGETLSVEKLIKLALKS